MFGVRGEVLFAVAVLLLLSLPIKELVASAPAYRRSALAGPLVPAAGERKVLEYRVKAAFMYNFAKFTTWPRGSFDNYRSPFVIAVLGKDPFGKILDSVLRDKKIGRHPIVVRRVKDLTKLETVHMVYLGEMSKRARKVALARLREMPVFTIGEGPTFTKRGGICRFYIEGEKVRFEVNVRAAASSGVKLSSKLLRLARIVKHEP